MPIDKKYLKKVRTRHIKENSVEGKLFIYEIDKNHREDGNKFYGEYEFVVTMEESSGTFSGEYTASTISDACKWMRDFVKDAKIEFAKEFYGDTWKTYGKDEFYTCYA